MNYQMSFVPVVRRITASIFALLLASCAGSFGSVEYAVIELAPPAGYDLVQPRDINDAGQITGSMYQFHPADMSQYLHRGFLWQTGAVQELPELPGYRSAATQEINEGGTIVGRLFLTNDSSPGSITVTWGPSGVTNVAPSHIAGGLAFECAINSFGCIAGSWTPAGTWQQRAFTVIDGNFLDIATLGSVAIPMGMNDSNVMVGSYGPNGWRAFMWSQATGMTALDTIADKQGLVTAHAINNQGLIIGRRLANGLDRAYCYFQGVVTDLGALGGTNSSPSDLNERGVIVGTADTSERILSLAVAHAFVYSSAQGMRDLNELIAKNSGWGLTTADAINNYGQIVGYGTLNGRSSGFLLQPIPGIALGSITNGTVVLSLSNLVLGTTYIIQRSESIPPYDWNDVLTIVADADTFSWPEPFYGNSKQVFYRIVGR